MDFLSNFRTTFGPQPFTKTDPLMQKRYNEANWDRFNRDIDEGKVKGTVKNAENEVETLRKMDRLYRLLANEFQDRFYYNHFDQENGKWNEIARPQMLKEATDFVNEIIKERGLNNEQFANGKTFLENFRQYGYNPILLPDIDEDSDYSTGIQRYTVQLRPAFRSASAKKPTLN